MSNTTLDIGKTIDTAVQVITDPVGFYKGMPQSGGFKDPLIFAAVAAFAAALIVFVLSVVGLGPLGAMGLGSVVMIPIYPIAVVIGCFIMGAILFVIFKLMGSEKNYEVAVRCFAYSCAVVPVVAAASIIPFIGNVASQLWGCFLMYVAAMHVHGLDDNKSKIVFGVLAAILVLGSLNQ